MVVYGYLVYQESSFPLENKINLIGRAPSCHLIFTHPSISKEHAIIEFADVEGPVVKDLNSLNGTTVNGTRLPKGGQALLHHNDVLSFGKDPVQYTFLLSAAYQKQKKSTQSPLVTREKEKDVPVSLVDPNVINEERGNRPREVVAASPNKNMITFAQHDESKLRESDSKVGAALNKTADSEAFKKGSPNPSVQDPNKQSQIQSQYLEKSEKLIHHNELLELNEKVLEREELLIKKENELKLYKSEAESLREEAEKYKSKLKALELYASELQRKNDLLTRELNERNATIREMENTDWTRKAQIVSAEAIQLRQLLVSKDEEINSYKKQIQVILQRQAEGTGNASHYQNFLEQQAKELANAKRLIQEYENRSEECKRKWNQLIKENINKEEKLKGLTLQLNRQIETYQALYSETDQKIAALHTKFAQMVSQDEESRERDAAEFLVVQMKNIQEERERIALENEQLHLQTQDLIEEVKRLNNELQEYQKYFDKNEMNGILEGKPINVGKMKARIEELEDLIHEMKQKEGVRKAVELVDILADLEKKLANQVRINEELKQKLLEFNSGTSTQDQNAIDFFSKLLDDKDQKIVYLQRQADVFSVKRSKEKQYQMELEKLRETLKQVSLQYENYKTRQTKLEDAITGRIGGVGGTLGTLSPPGELISNPIGGGHLKSSYDLTGLDSQANFGYFDEEKFKQRLNQMTGNDGYLNFEQRKI